jgi:hypothetical protein
MTLLSWQGPTPRVGARGLRQVHMSPRRASDRRSSSAVEHPIRNRVVEGSIPSSGSDLRVWYREGAESLGRNVSRHYGTAGIHEPGPSYKPPRPLAELLSLRLILELAFLLS